MSNNRTVVTNLPKYVIMAAVAALFFAGVVTSGGHVRADDGWGAYDSNGNWHCVWQWDSNGHIW